MFLNPDGCSKRSIVPADQVGRKESFKALKSTLEGNSTLVVMGL